jgi:hypothetical protein
MTGSIIGPPQNLSTAGRNALGAGFRPPGMVVYNTDTGRLEYNAGSDATPNWLVLTPNQFGVTFPTTGLFSGYRFTLFYTGGQGEFMYRADIDGTYPWHAISATPLVLRRTSVGTSSITFQRAGVYRGIWAGSSAVSSGGDAGLNTGFAGGSQGAGNFTAGGAADDLVVTAGGTTSITISGTTNPAGNVGALFFPVRLI